MRGIVFRTQQSLLFACDEQEEDRPSRRSRKRPKRIGNRENLRDPGRIVERTVVDPVARRIGGADAQMIVMSGVDHDLIAQCGIAARQPADHVGCASLRQLVLKHQRGRHTQRYRLEIAALRRFDEFGQVSSRKPYEIGCRIFGDPRRDLEARLAF